MRRMLQVLMICIALIAIYTALFFATRECAVITDYDAYEVPHSIQVCYFSRTPGLNAAWFYFFYPVHALIGHPHFESTLTRQELDEYQRGRPYYLVDPAVLP